MVVYNKNTYLHTVFTVHGNILTVDKRKASMLWVNVALVWLSIPPRKCSVIFLEEWAGGLRSVRSEHP